MTSVELAIICQVTTRILARHVSQLTVSPSLDFAIRAPILSYLPGSDFVSISMRMHINVYVRMYASMELNDSNISQFEV